MIRITQWMCIGHDPTSIHDGQCSSKSRLKLGLNHTSNLGCSCMPLSHHTTYISMFLLLHVNRTNMGLKGHHTSTFSPQSKVQDSEKEHIKYNRRWEMGDGSKRIIGCIQITCNLCQCLLCLNENSANFYAGHISQFCFKGHICL